ncbi:WW domain-containing protein [Ascosphaera apis ARSEF 7405]|uniref:WW domain-containing protein n=1 Tax=Ascosphaera apis ARSEF 7405 TaxID=392613 RepID=A0A162ICK0_9EURO|nr:WW domain-containing protein [Ascosphaera apis ARSEF 7405]
MSSQTLHGNGNEQKEGPTATATDTTQQKVHVQEEQQSSSDREQSRDGDSVASIDSSTASDAVAAHSSDNARVQEEGVTNEKIEGEEEEPEQEKTEETKDKTKAGEAKETEDTAAPPLPDEEPPEALPDQIIPEDDGWAPVWDDAAQQYYFYNRFTGLSQWENPRVPDSAAATTTAPPIPATAPPQPSTAGGYNPAIHGDYDPTAPYAQQNKDGEEDGVTNLADPSLIYAATGTFNRFTGQWQPADFGPDRFKEENRRKRQLDAFFDVDAAANSHDGRSLRAERSAKKLSKKELKEFREKRRERKEEKRRAWLRD